MSNPFNDALDEEEQTSTDNNETFATDRYYEALNSESATKDKTIGIAVSEEMHAFYTELQHADEVDVEVSQSIRDHLENLAHRHERVFEKAMRKLEIDREL
jgi:ribosomal protein L31